MRFITGILIMLVFSFSALWSPKKTSAGESTKWDTFLNNFIQTYFVLHPEVAIDAGRHEFDGKLPDWSTEGLSRQGRWLHAEHDTASTFDEASLDAHRRFEREYLRAVITKELFWLESAEWPYKNPQYYSSALDPGIYISREYAPLATRMRAYIAFAKALPAAVEQLRKNLRTPLPRPYVERGATMFGGLASFFETDVPRVFASIKDPQLQEEFNGANRRAAEALNEMKAWFEKNRATATNAFALGEGHFLEMLRATERVDISLEDLEKVGRQDLERNLAELREACSHYASGKTIPECIELEQKRKPRGSPVEGARQQLKDLKSFIIEKDLVTIPSNAEARVAEAPSYRRWNFAYINIPGPYEKGLPSTYYIAPPDPNWTKEEQEAYLPGEKDLLFTSVHEVWPGHFLHYLHANRVQSKFAQIFPGYAFSEGWAHYAEEMMWEVGLGAGDPETHIGQLLNALLRNVRFLSAIGLHTGKMTVEESEKMFREVAFQDPGNARQQAARGTFDPAYLNYTLGKLMIRKLRDDWSASRGGRKAWREFHDKFLSFGGPPIPLVRKEMLGVEAGSLF